MAPDPVGPNPPKGIDSSPKTGISLTPGDIELIKKLARLEALEVVQKGIDSSPKTGISLTPGDIELIKKLARLETLEVVQKLLKNWKK